MANDMGSVTDRWARMMNAARNRWDKLTDADLQSVRGNAERLVAVLQARYGFARDEALRELGAWRLTLAGARRYEAVIEPPAPDRLGNNRFESWVEVSGGPVVLLVTKYLQDPVAATLEKQGFTVQTVTLPTAPQVGQLAGAKAVILNNVPAYELPNDFLRSLDFHVREQGGSLLMAGAFLAIGSCLSASTRNQVVAFILTVVICFLLLMAGFPLVQGFFQSFLPQGAVDAIAGLSLYTHFIAIAKGVVDLRDLIYFALTIGVWLYATAIVIDLKKAD